ncbi:MAG: dUTP diphosphatase [bacterium]|nr:dUTP diphosphatase [bacterium]
MARRPTLKFELLNKKAKLPQYAHEDDVGFDLYSTEKKTLKAGQWYTFNIGIASEVPKGWYVSVRDKSGLAAKHGLHTMAGVIDAGYRGEWGVVLINHGAKRYTVESGDKIAQGSVLQMPAQAKILQIEKLSETKRGKGGFGSTGRK